LSIASMSHPAADNTATINATLPSLTFICGFLSWCALTTYHLNVHIF
jgi:hypothetical protein